MSASFIEEWNSMFPLKMTAANLQQPNEAFVFGALSCFLQHININVAKMDEASFASDEERLRFRAEFCQYVDKLLKIGKPEDSFVYFDLVCPASKKTIYVLKALLNFYHFYKMIRDEIIGEATELIEAHEAAQLELNQLQRNKEIFRDRMAKIDQEHEYLNTRLPFVQKSIEDLQALSAMRQAQIIADQRLLTEAKLEQLSLEQRKQDLLDQVVTDEEAEALRKTLADLDAELIELDQIESDTIASHRALSEQSNWLGKNIEVGERFLETHSVDDMTAANQLASRVADASEEIATMTAKRAALAESIQSKLKSTDQLQQVVNGIASKLSHTNQNDDRELTQLKRDLRKATARQTTLDDKLRSISSQLEEAEAERDFIISETPRVLQAIRRTYSQF